jgi:hypothetical protein
MAMGCGLSFSVRKTSIRAGLALLLASVLAPTADAGLIDFNPTGGSTTIGGFNPGTLSNVVSFDLGAGDALAVKAISGGGLTVGSTFQLYYQTVITGFNLASGTKATPNGLNASNGYQLTEIATFNETVTSIGSNGNVQFALTPGQPNRTSIYFSDLAAPGATQANSITGAGYSSGTEIMRLTTTSDSSNYTDTTKTGATPGTPALNQSGSGDYGGVTTDQGTGSVSVTANVNFSLANFFKTQPVIASLFSSNIKLPFTEIAPSNFFNDPFAPGAPTITPNVGANNGTSGPDFLLQISGASQSFAVPEPASVAMTLMGLGGVGLGSFAARRRRVVNA